MTYYYYLLRTYLPINGSEESGQLGSNRDWAAKKLLKKVSARRWKRNSWGSSVECDRLRDSGCVHEVQRMKGFGEIGQHMGECKIVGICQWRWSDSRPAPLSTYIIFLTLIVRVHILSSRPTPVIYVYIVVWTLHLAPKHLAPWTLHHYSTWALKLAAWSLKLRSGPKV